MLKLQEVAAALGIKRTEDLTPEHWDQAVQNLPRPALPFLQEPFIREGGRYMLLPDEVIDQAITAAKCIDAHPPATALIWHAHHLLHLLHKGISNWPDDIGLGEHSGMFYLLALLSGWQHMRAVHLERGIPTQIVHDTMCDIHLSLHRYRRHHGRWGLHSLYAGGWLTNHLRGQLYRIGRLNYLIRSFDKNHVFYRQRSSQKVVALTAAGHEYRQDGQFNGAGGVTHTAGLWTSTFNADTQSIQGHPIDPASGCTLPKQVHLPADQFQVALSAGDGLIDIHIPATGPMTFQLCGQSLTAAKNFFQIHFPQRKTRAYHCESWLTDPQFQSYLPPTSNIIQFLREFYIVPCASDPWAAVRFVFDMEIPYGHSGLVDLSALPRDTTLQRAILDHLKSGQHWRKTAAVLLFEDFHWGTQPYRTGHALDLRSYS